MEKVLKLTVNKKWFDMYKSGVKKEEYRELKQYWIKRLCKKYVDTIAATFKHFDLVEFTNGYSKNSPKLTFEFKGIKIDNDYNLEWGGYLMSNEEGFKTDCFIISIGSEVSRSNC